MRAAHRERVPRIGNREGKGVRRRECGEGKAMANEVYPLGRAAFALLWRSVDLQGGRGMGTQRGLVSRDGRRGFCATHWGLGVIEKWLAF